MTTTRCDRCGEEIVSYPWQQMKFPIYKIQAINDANSNLCRIDLCHECEKKFYDWLHNGNSKKGENNHG